ncbi:MAG: O-antigen translocase [Dongiaceae bacterium]
MQSDPDKPPLTDPLRQEEAQAAEAAEPQGRSYGEILKSSALIGGSSALNIAIGIVRTKAMALMLGPGGFGLMALYGAIVDLFVSIAGMGINSSGVRQIAEAVGSGDANRISRTVTVLRRTAVVLGLSGAVLLAAFSRQVSTLTFGSDEHAEAVALLSVVVLLRLVTEGQGALVQGMRRIGDLARMGVLGGIFGTLLGIPLVYFLREDGVVPYLIGAAAATAMVAWWYGRKLNVEPPSMTASQVRHEAASLLKFGFAFMASGFLMIGAAYAVRTMVLRMVGLEAAGFYQAAWTIGGLYVANILQAMGADFYPRLVGAAQDNSQCNRLVNEQEQVSLLLAGPGVIATLTFAPLVIEVFYAAEFAGAVDTLRWICLGMALRVISWPMGFLIVAKGKRALFLGTEMAWSVVNIALAWICVSSFGLNGAGIAFFASYVFYCFLVYPAARRLSGFRWSTENRKTGCVFLFSIAIVFCGFYTLPPVVATSVGVVAMIASGIHSIRALLALTTAERIPRQFQRLIAWFRRAAK